MKRFRFLKGAAVTMAAMALVVGLSVPVTAANAADAKLSQNEVSQVGVPAAPAISLKGQVGSGQVITGWNITLPVIPKGYRLYLNVYSNNNPLDSENGTWRKDSYGKNVFTPYSSFSYGGNAWQDTPSQDIVINRSYSSFTLGDKKVVAYYFDEAGYKAACDVAYAAGQIAPSKADYISPASNAIGITITEEIAQNDIETMVKSTSITMNFYSYKNATGFEIYRKVGSKYKKIATIAKRNYTDKGLVSKTKYSYKVRPYYKNMRTNKISYGKYTSFSRVTAGSALNLKLTVSGTKKVKLTWKKVANVKKYEVYRRVGYDTYSDASSVSKGYNNGYSTWELVKTLKKSKKSYSDKKTSANQSYQYKVVAVIAGSKSARIEETAGITFAFGSPQVYNSYSDAYGNRTVQWKKGYGLDGYIIEKYMKNAVTGQEEWTEVKKLGKNTTSYKFPAVAPVQDTDGSWTSTETDYRIRAYKGIKKSTYYSVTTSKRLGMVSGITAKKAANGIQISWKPVSGAAYYRVYRIPATAYIKNNDIGGYEAPGGYSITEYVGAVSPVQVDVAAWNAKEKAYTDAYAAWDKITAATKPTRPLEHMLTSGNGLKEDKTYYYQNYQYSRSMFYGTSAFDYSGDIYSSYTSQYTDDNKNTAYASSVAEVDSNRDYSVGPQAGVSYQYYVVAFRADEQTRDEYIKKNTNSYTTPEEAGEAYDWYVDEIAATPNTLNATSIPNVTKRWDDSNIEETMGVKSMPTIVYTNVKAPGQVKIKSIKAGKKSATIKIKKVSGATAYKIYRSTKKKGTYLCVGTTTKTTYKDSGLKKGKKYYYKIVAVKANESGADVAGKASKVKRITSK